MILLFSVPPACRLIDEMWDERKKQRCWTANICISCGEHISLFHHGTCVIECDRVYCARWVSDWNCSSCQMQKVSFANCDCSTKNDMAHSTWCGVFGLTTIAACVHAKCVMQPDPLCMRDGHFLSSVRQSPIHLWLSPVLQTSISNECRLHRLMTTNNNNKNKKEMESTLDSLTWLTWFLFCQRMNGRVCVRAHMKIAANCRVSIPLLREREIIRNYFRDL